MGWCLGTRIFDAIAEEILVSGEVNKKSVIRKLYNILREDDWDTEEESKFYEHPILQEIIQEREEWLNAIRINSSRD